MLKKIKYYMVGLLTGLIVAGGVGYADDVYYNLVKVDYSIMIDEKKFENDLPILNYNGTTYLPLKAIGDALDINVKWNNSKNFIEIEKGVYNKVRTLNNDIDGSSYIGETRDNLPHGFGLLSYKDGKTYLGLFIKGYYDGLGTITSADKTSYMGEWKEGKMVGDGVFTLTDGKKCLTLNGQISSNNITESNNTPLFTTSDTIETKMDGDFEGFESDRIYKLANGQIWQQTSYDYQYHYAYRPNVLIYKSGSVYKMKVDGCDKTPSVTQLK